MKETEVAACKGKCGLYLYDKFDEVQLIWQRLISSFGQKVECDVLVEDTAGKHATRGNAIT